MKRACSLLWTSVALVAASSATACSGAPPPPPPAPPPPVPGLVTSAEPTTPAPPAPAPAPVLAGPPSPFHEVTRLSLPSPGGGVEPEVELLRVGTELFVARTHNGQKRLFRIKDGVLSRDEVTMPGGANASSFEQVRGIHGTWPDHAYLVTVSLDGGGRYHNTWHLFRRDPVGPVGPLEARAPGAPGTDTAHRGEYAWKPILQHNDPNVMEVQMSPKTAGPMWDGELAVFGDGRVLGRFNDELRVLDGPRGTVPKLGVAAACKGHARVAYGDFRGGSKLAALPSGHLVAAGNDCSGEGLALEWFAPGSARGNLVTFGAGCTLHKMVGARLDALTLWAHCGKDERDVFFGFDGSKIAEIAYPGTTIMDIVASASGALHVVDGVGNLLRTRQPGGVWSGIPLGDAGGALAVLGEDDFWLFDGTSLWRSKGTPGPAQPFAWPEDGAQVATSFHAPRAATSACESIFVLFFGFARTTPDDYDFPLTRAALKGHPELENARLVVTREGGRKYFGAFVPTLALGKQLAATVEKGIQDAHPHLLCARPQEVREIDINWSTGAVVK